ncbi:hypothetical protein V5P93_000830 [Actinokineospora auranticolor]|uniref:SpaA-like prealbumin fold domain-containing protein n=1 Tax=Actinokineospora auranticolor TaxID=155976 RepID=A0A2S6GYI3_9PSEU|nr:hypothetical protein [Actinokineospora auranticolor]PPK70293.1 hypothetical protein CLV40_102204 [Actinokineospora auranticolor]
MRRITLGARLAALAAGIATLSGSLLIAGAPTAAAEFVEGLGVGTAPQPYKNYPKDKHDWLGSYIVGGKTVWCVKFAYLEPDKNEKYGEPQTLVDKYGGPIDAAVSANISYLLLQYGETKDRVKAAALAHLLHTWTAPSGPDHDTQPTRTFDKVAYDPAWHEQNLPADVRADVLKAVADLRAEATANHGPWTTVLTKPTKPQVIGTPDKWTIEVRNAAGSGVGNVPVTVDLDQATVDGKSQVTVKTKENGAGVELDVVPTGTKPKVSIKLDSPADKPSVLPPVDGKKQAVVTTGGKKELKANAEVEAVTPPGKVVVTKLDEKTGKGIPSVSLRLTAADKTAPAVGQDGKPLVGADGKPVVLVTGADGKATVPDLKTPQDVCVIEVAAPAGYEQAFNPQSPPTVCDRIKDGATLDLTVSNKPNVPKVPKTIPAGDDPVNTAAVVGGDGPSTGLLLTLGALLLLATGVGTTLIRRARGPQAVSRKMRKDWGH